MDKVTEKLMDAVETELDMLKEATDASERSKRIDNINVLYKLLLEHEKENDLVLEKEYQRGIESEKAELEAQLRLKEVKANTVHDCVEAVGGLVRMLASGAFLGQILCFEEHGTIGSKAFQLWSRTTRF